MFYRVSVIYEVFEELTHRVNKVVKEFSVSPDRGEFLAVRGGTLQIFRKEEAKADEPQNNAKLIFATNNPFIVTDITKQAKKEADEQ